MRNYPGRCFGSGKIRTSVAVIAITVAVFSLLLPTILGRIFKAPPPQIVCTSTSPDGQWRLEITEKQSGGYNRNYEYILKLFPSKNPGDASSFVPRDFDRIAEFTAKWDKNGVRVGKGGAGDGFVAFGRVSKGTPQWSELDVASEINIEDLMNRLKTVSTRTTSTSASNQNAPSDR